METGEALPRLLRARRGGLALIAGGLMYRAFWAGPVGDREMSLVDSHGLQLAFYGSMIASLGFGLWRVASAQSTALGANLHKAGPALALLGLVSFLWIQALGFLILGALRIWARRNDLVG